MSVDKPPNVFDFVKAINSKTEIDPEFISAYVPFIVHRALNVALDSLMCCNEMNRRSFLPKDTQYMFLKHAISKGKRYGEWIKVPEDEKINLLMAFYNYNKKRAEEVLPLLTEDDLKEILSSMEKGGQTK